ncbi:MAG: rolling circle replication-associated protein, partial [Pseudonocardiaceae bacterium]
MSRAVAGTSTSLPAVVVSSGVELPAGPGLPGRAGGGRPGLAEGRAGVVSSSGGLAAGGGLVPCAITVREQDVWSPEGVWRPAFPGAKLVGAAADLLPAVREAGGRGERLGEGPRWEVVVSPGVLRVRTRDYARAERGGGRREAHRRAGVDMAATFLADGQEVPEPLPTRGTIVAWSPKSRARLVARLSDLDYTRLYGRYRTCTTCNGAYDPELACCPACQATMSSVTDRSRRLPAMVTLTYPGDWLTVAPTSEASVSHFAVLCKRYARAWGEPLVCVWKREFQARGAPHFHLSTTPPMGWITVADPETGQATPVDFRQWLSITWAAIVAHPDPEQRRRHRVAGTGVDYAEGIKGTDPRRMAVYFAKYGTAGGKEYQHHVPTEWITSYLVCEDCGRDYDQAWDECPDCGCPEAELVEEGSAGRFWGYRGLRPVLAVRQVSPQAGIAAGRVLRRWYRAKGL